MATFFYRSFLILFSIFIIIYLFDFLKIKNVRPDIVLIIVIYIAYRKGAFSGEITGFFAGLAEDFIYSTLFGAYSFSKFITGYITGKIITNFIIDNFFVQFFIILIVTLINNIIFMSAILVFTNVSFVDYLGSVFWLKIIYTSVVGVFLWYLLEYFEKRTGGI
ncbi:MAG TPA: rod shape-determining protein MreD [Spirochaetota bacterium]|nr:rod shape-determining protein MreD [Spirochaetota bacterium]HOM38380.1 rod shape-determining protein MreD [Spirochaetota bacterium]HPQ48402.1 rod shape-determining protein MreD [Spirochaetota bacterium]